MKRLGARTASDHRATPALVALLVAGLGAASGASGAQDCRAETPEVAAIRAVATGIVAADNRRDIEAVLGYYATDAILLPPGEPPVAGRAALRPRYEALFEGFDPEIEVHLGEACADGDLGFVRGRNRGRLVDRRTGEPRPLDDAFLMLLRREPDGAWRISHLMWHRQSPPQGEGDPG